MFAKKRGFVNFDSDNTKKLLKSKKIDSIIIPGGLTGLIQAPDVSWNAPFKAKLRELYNKWMANAPKTFTKAGNVRAPSRATLCDFVVEAWQSQLITAENHHHENNELFLIDDDE